MEYTKESLLEFKTEMERQLVAIRVHSEDLVVAVALRRTRKYLLKLVLLLILYLYYTILYYIIFYYIIFNTRIILFYIFHSLIFVFIEVNNFESTRLKTLF